MALGFTISAADRVQRRRARDGLRPRRDRHRARVPRVGRHQLRAGPVRRARRVGHGGALRQRGWSVLGRRSRSRSSPARCSVGSPSCSWCAGCSRQPRLLLFVATIGVAQVILLLQLQLPTDRHEPVPFPTPDRRTAGTSARSPSGASSSSCSSRVPLIVVGARRSSSSARSFGLAVRSAADNPSAASLSGIRVKAVSTQVWVLAGVAGGGQRAARRPGPEPAHERHLASRSGPTSCCAALDGRARRRDGVVPARHARRHRSRRRRGAGARRTPPGRPAPTPLVMFVLLVVLVLVRARSQSADESAWTLTPRSRAGAGRAAQTSARAVRRATAGIGLLLLASVSCSRSS